MAGLPQPACSRQCCILQGLVASQAGPNLLVLPELVSQLPHECYKCYYNWQDAGAVQLPRCWQPDQQALHKLEARRCQCLEIFAC